MSKRKAWPDLMIVQMEKGGSFLETDLEFHQTIVAGAREPVLSRMSEAILPLLQEGRRQTNTLPNMRTKSSNYHVLIAIAIEERNIEQARQLMQSHIEQMLEPLKKAKEAQGEADQMKG